MEGGAYLACGLAWSWQIRNDHATSSGWQGSWLRDHGVGTQSR
jgi:hypothetical protein